MKFKNKLLGLTLGLALTIGVGYSLANNQGQAKMASAEEEVVYTLDGTKSETYDGDNGNYAAEKTRTFDNVEWKITANLTTNPWRLGGNKITNTPRTVYNSTAISNNVTKIDIAVGDIASGATIASTKFAVYSSLADLTAKTNALEEFDLTASKNTTLTVTKAGETNWENAFYCLTFNITVSGTSNKYIQLKSIKFYAEASSEPSVALTATQEEVEIGNSFTFKAEAKNAEGATISWTSSNEEVGTIDAETGVFNALAEGKTTITASMTYNGVEYKKTFEVTVPAPEKEYRAAKYPVVGQTYLIGYENGDKKGYYDGTMSTYYAVVKEKPSKGIKVTIEKEEKGYLLKTSTNKYVGVSVNGSHTNFVYSSSKIYSNYILSEGTFKWTISNKEYFLALGNKFGTGGAYAWLSINKSDYSRLKLFEEVSVAEPADKDIVNFFVENYLLKNSVAIDDMGTGKCKTDGLYTLAKKEYTALTEAQKNIFVGDADFADMLARYNAWAVANGDTTIAVGSLTQSAVNYHVLSQNNNLFILIISLVSFAVLGSSVLYFVRKKKISK